MLILKPREYKLNGRWSLIPKNKIDTVNTYLIENAIPEEDEVIDSATINDVTISNSSVTLPIADSTKFTYRVYAYNYYSSLTVKKDLAKSRIECVMASGTKVFKLTKAVATVPTAKVTLRGKTAVLNRGKHKYDDYPSYTDINDDSFSITTWINKNAEEKLEDQLSWTYNENSFPLHPWVNKVIAVPTKNNKPEVTTKYEDEYIPTVSDVVTSWTFNDDMNPVPRYDDWTIESNYSGDDYFMLPPNANNFFTQYAFPSDYTIRVRDIKIPIKAVVNKIDDYTYEVNWSAPVRVSYMAASRRQAITTIDIDNWAFVDTITEIELSLLSKPYSTNVITDTYVWDENRNDAVASSIVKDNPIDIRDSEFFTQGTQYGTQSWKYLLSKKLLQKYKDGKCIVELDVKASWALKNDVHVNTQLVLYLPDGQLLKRKDQTIIFEVKNVEKVFDQNEFIFRLKLMEV